MLITKNFVYKGMNAPSFRCTDDQNGNTILHYYSERPGLEFIVIGLVKVVAHKLHGSEVECKIIKSKGDDCDHVQFEIIEQCNFGGWFFWYLLKME